MAETTIGGIMKKQKLQKPKLQTVFEHKFKKGTPAVPGDPLRPFWELAVKNKLFPK